MNDEECQCALCPRFACSPNLHFCIIISFESELLPEILLKVIRISSVRSGALESRVGGSRFARDGAIDAEVPR
jgi:hypothetical protein